MRPAAVYIAFLVLGLAGCVSSYSAVPAQMRALVGHDGVFNRDAILVRDPDGTVWAIDGRQEKLLPSSHSLITRIPNGTVFRVVAARKGGADAVFSPYLVCRLSDSRAKFAIASEGDDDFVTIVIPD